MILKQRILTYFIIFTTFALLNVTIPFSKIAVAQPPNFVQYVNPELGTSIFYPANWPYLFNDVATVFIPPETINSLTGLAFITVENPVELSNTDPDTLLSQIETYIMQKDNFTLRDSSFGENSVLLVYSYNEPDFGTVIETDIVLVQGSRIANMRYQADPGNVNLYAPIFAEMVSTYQFAPSSIIPPPEVAADPESACFLGEDVTVLSCLGEGASLPRAEAGVITRSLNPQFQFQ